MSSCYCCNEEITETNKSDEHVIPNFLGGKLKLKNSLCKICNDDFGLGIDNELYKQLKQFVDVLPIQRHRTKENKRVELSSTEGNSIIVGENLQPLPFLSITIPDKETPIVLYAKDEKGLEIIKNSKIRELKQSGKYKNIEVSKEEVRHEGVYYFNNTLSRTYNEVGFGGKDYFRAIAKIAVNFALYNDIDKGHLSKEIITFITKGESTKGCEFYYPSHYEIHSLGEKEISHLIYLFGCPDERVLYAYIELLNSECCIILLNNNYSGQKIRKTYCYDLINVREIEKNADIRLRKFHIEDLRVLPKAAENHQIKIKNLIDKIADLQG